MIYKKYVFFLSEDLVYFYKQRFIFSGSSLFAEVLV